MSKLDKNSFSVKYRGNDVNYSQPIEKLCNLAEDTELSLSETITIGTSNIKVTISKESIKAGGKSITIETLRDIYEDMVDNNFDTNWSVSFPIVQIGCSEFSASEIKQVIDIYEKFN